MRNGRFLVSIADQDRLLKLIQNGFAYHSLTIISTSSMHDKLKLDQYHRLSVATHALSLSDVLETELLQKIQRGNIVAISKGRRLDVDDVFVITHTGYLILHLTKDTYYKLGLIGKKSKYSSNSSILKYVVSIDLSTFDKSKAQSDRIRWAFANILPSKMDFHLVDISDIEESGVKSCEIKTIHKTNILTPDISSLQFKNIQDIEEEILEIFEWFGMVQCDSDWVKDGCIADPFISVYSPPFNSSVNSVSVEQIIGMIHPSQASQIVKHILETMENDWFTLSLTGFRDSPISWNHQEHGYLFTGENDLLVIGNKNGILMAQVVGCHAKDVKF